MSKERNKNLQGNTQEINSKPITTVTPGNYRVSFLMRCVLFGTACCEHPDTCSGYDLPCSLAERHSTK